MALKPPLARPFTYGSFQYPSVDSVTEGQMRLFKNQVIHHTNVDKVPSWNMTGELLGPQGITGYSKCPSRVLNSISHSLPMQMQIKLYVPQISSFV